MTSEQQLQIFDDFTAKMREVLVAKANDYAGDVDRLRNFKQVGDVTGIGAPKAVLTHIATKVSRLGTLLGSGKAPSNESVGDSVLDLANYSILLHMVLVEGSEKNAEVVSEKGFICFEEAFNMTITKLPAEYAGLLAANMSPERFPRLKSIHYKIGEEFNCLLDAFVWDDSPQGFMFWNWVRFFLTGTSEELPPLPEKEAEPEKKAEPEKEAEPMPFIEAFKQTLAKLPKEYAGLAEVNLSDNWVDELKFTRFTEDTKFYSLKHAFVWYNTPQGNNFWREVQEFLVGKRAELPPIPDNNNNK